MSHAAPRAYAGSAAAVAGIIVLDYVLAYGALGLAAIFNRRFTNRLTSILAGIVFTYGLRFLCHFLSGWLLFASYAPEGTPAWLYSLTYNGSYMLPAVTRDGIQVISVNMLLDNASDPVIWRGPMLHKALEQFLTDVYWDDPDFLLVDLPPGTGDISISLASFLPRAEVYVVTTPQPAAQRVAQRAGFMAEKVNLTVKGVIENMSWFTGDDGQRYELFGAGGGAELAQRLEVPLLGRVPLVPLLREGADEGRPIVLTEPDGEAARAFGSIAEEIDVNLAPTRRYHRELKLI